MTDNSRASGLRSRVAALRGPGIVQAQASVRSLGKHRASAAMAIALAEMHWSRRDAARHLGVDERVIRDWLDGNRQPAWIPLALPRDGYLAYLDALLGDLPPESVKGAANG